MGEPFTSLGPYDILERLGTGEITAVYRGRDPLADRSVAIKTLHAFIPPSSRLGAWHSTLGSVVQTVKGLSHPNVITTLASGLEGDIPWVAMELCEGLPLAALIREGSLSSEHRLGVAIDIARALSHAHGRGVIHMALKPSNVIVSADGHARVGDFGLSRLCLPSTISTSGPARPMPHYRSPEQLVDRHPDERSDIFSFGTVLFELLLGSPPFRGDSHMGVVQQILNVSPRLLLDGSRSLPDALAKVLRRCLAKDPLERFQSARELETDLDAAQRELASSSSRELVLPAAPEPAAPARLKIEEGGQSRVLVLDKPVVTIGRLPENDVTCNDDQVSRSHALVVAEGDQWTIEDTNSSHGTYVNGERISRVVLHGGDVLELGRDRHIRILFLGPGDVEDLAPGLAPRERRTVDRNFDLLLDVSRALAASLDVDDVLNVVIDAAMELTEAERGFLMLKDADGAYRTRVMRCLAHEDMSPEEQRISTTVVDRCIASGRPVAMSNVDSEFGMITSIVELELMSVLGVPLMRKDEVIGVLYIDSRKLANLLRPGLMEVLQAFAGQAAVSIENARLYELATHDALTGLYLRRYFEARLKEELHRAQRHNRPLSLMFIDVDRFKNVNDSHGHAVGDKVLKGIADVIFRQVRISDIPARYGGEEFVLLAPETTPEAAEIVAERIRERVKGTPYLTETGEIRITVSIGVSTMGAGPRDGETLLERADRALYRAKALGRDRVFVQG